jgi:hypothetical protein
VIGSTNAPPLVAGGTSGSGDLAVQNGGCVVARPQAGGAISIGVNATG